MAGSNTSWILPGSSSEDVTTLSGLLTPTLVSGMLDPLDEPGLKYLSKLTPVADYALGTYMVTLCEYFLFYFRDWSLIIRKGNYKMEKKLGVQNSYTPCAPPPPLIPGNGWKPFLGLSCVKTTSGNVVPPPPKKG